MTKKQLTEKQHYVPQFYLRNFSNEEGHLHIYDAKNFRKMKPRSFSGVCYDKFFYAIETGKPDEVSQEVEDFFSKGIEDPLSTDLPFIIKKIEGNKQIFDFEKYTLAILMSTMWLRNPTMRGRINKMGEDILKQTHKVMFSHPSIEDKLNEIEREMGSPLSKEERSNIKKMVTDGNYKINFTNQQHLNFMLDSENLEGFSNLFCGQDWLVHISKCRRQFVTSDNPITALIPKKKGFWPATFLERTHIFPLTPQIAIEARYPRQNSGKKFKRRTYFKGNEEKADKINLQIASQANYIYASRPEEIEWFDHYAKYVKKLETLKDKLNRMNG